MFFSKEDLLKNNVEKISFLLGILMVALSYVFAFITIGGFVFWIALVIALSIEVGALYAAASRKFETE